MKTTNFFADEGKPASRNAARGISKWMGKMNINQLKSRAAQLREEGFTLIELLVVVLILGILSGIVVVAVANARTEAVNKACISNQVVLMKALDSYYADPTLGGGAGYPDPLGDDLNGATVYSVSQLNDILVPKFLHSLPPYVGDGTTADYKLAAYRSSEGESVHIVIGNTLGDVARCKPIGQDTNAGEALPAPSDFNLPA